MWAKIKRLFLFLQKKLFTPPSLPTLSRSLQLTINQVNRKIEQRLGIQKNFILLTAYENYFAFLKRLGLEKEFHVLTSQNSLIIRGSVFSPLLVNRNNQKVIIFCHGITGNR